MRSAKPNPVRPAGCRSDSRKHMAACIQIVLLICAGLLHGFGAGMQNANCILFGNLCIFACVAVFCVCNLRKRILLLVFCSMVFVFLSCRPVIDLFRGAAWWTEFPSQDVLFALRGVALSVLMLYVGAVLYRCASDRKSRPAELPELPEKPKRRRPLDVGSLQLPALCLYAISMVFFLYCEFDKLAFMRGRTYTEYFTSYSPSYPSLFGTIGYCMPFALCAFLATLPRKKLAFPVLAVYLLSAVPQLIIGVRNPFVLNALFIFLYYFIRDALGADKRWLGRWEICAIIAALPLIFISFSIINYTREGMLPQSSNIFSMVVDLFHKQGVSFRTLCIGHAALPNLPGAKRNFTFGPIIDYLLYGRIGRLLFGTTALPSGNSAELAARGHSLAHAISFVGHPGYLEGHGLGSSYILEVFADYGYVGIAVFSLLLGMFLLYCMDAVRKGWFLRTVILACLGRLFFIPRAEATDWIEFLFHIHFWFVILACIIGGRVLSWVKVRLQSSDHVKKSL